MQYNWVCSTAEDILLKRQLELPPTNHHTFNDSVMASYSEECTVNQKFTLKSNKMVDSWLRVVTH